MGSMHNDGRPDTQYNMVWYSWPNTMTTLNHKKSNLNEPKHLLLPSPPRKYPAERRVDTETVQRPVAAME